MIGFHTHNTPSIETTYIIHMSVPRWHDTLCKYYTSPADVVQPDKRNTEQKLKWPTIRFVLSRDYANGRLSWGNEVNNRSNLLFLFVLVLHQKSRVLILRKIAVILIHLLYLIHGNKRDIGECKSWGNNYILNLWTMSMGNFMQFTSFLSVFVCHQLVLLDWIKYYWLKKVGICTNFLKVGPQFY